MQKSLFHSAGGLEIEYWGAELYHDMAGREQVANSGLPPSWLYDPYYTPKGFTNILPYTLSILYQVSEFGDELKW